ncbi:MAG: 50S ribosomal protein L24 [Myxococcota bacterium]
MHVKMNDKVILLSGKDRGETGKVIAIDHRKGRVKVERRNIMVKHKRPNPLLGEDGARLEVENWLDASNVALYSEELDGPERVSRRYVGKGGAFFVSKALATESFEGEGAPGVIQKVRVGKKTGHVYDQLKG